MIVPLQLKPDGIESYSDCTTCRDVDSDTKVNLSETIVGSHVRACSLDIRGQT